MAKSETRPDVLYARMLGGFTLKYNGALIAGGSKFSESQFIYLLQILLHHRKTGVSRDRLEELLFEGRELADVHHTLQSIIYNAKTRLKKLGLPPANYIVQRGGLFYWTDEIPVEEDAERFEALLEQAEATSDADERLALLTDAIHAYGGEFLPMQAAVIWVAQEARHCRERFCYAVEQAVELLRQHQDFFQMEALGRYCAKIDPLADWEAVTMEALAALGRYDDARRLYDETVQYYFNEQGVRPSKKLMEKFHTLSRAMQHRHAALDEIQAGLSGRSEMTPGGYLCSYPVFQGIYRMVERMLERGGQSVFLMLCTVVDGKGNPMKDGPVLEELTARLADAVQNSIRRGDALCRYGKGQYLVLLVNTTRENCAVVQKRINRRFIQGRQRSGIEYYVNSVFWEAPEDSEGGGLLDG